MKPARIDIASIRREQIVEATIAVIAEQGLHNLSLSEIETKAGMKRGQLTYYFKHKEDILLAVFDRVLQQMYERLGKPPGSGECGDGDGERSGWKVMAYLFETLLTRPQLSEEFHCLQHTFLAQIGFREDFRKRLASLYDEWRTRTAEDLGEDLKRQGNVRRVSPRLMASLMQAMLHGLAVQKAADPHAFDGGEMLNLCLDVLGSYLGMTPERVAETESAAPPKSASAPRSGRKNGSPMAAKG